MSQNSASSKDGQYLKALVDDLRERVNTLKQFDAQAEINAYCDDLESTVMMTIESAFKQLNAIQDGLLAEIQAYRSERLQQEALTSHTPDDREAIQQQLFDLSSKIREFEKISFAVYDSRALMPGTIQASDSLYSDLKKRTQNVRTLLRERAFQNKFMKFFDNNLAWLDISIVGNLSISPTDIQGTNNISTVILNQEQTNLWTVDTRISCGLFLSNGNFVYAQMNGKLGCCDPLSGRVLFEQSMSQTSALAQMHNGDLLVGTYHGSISIWCFSGHLLIESCQLAGHLGMILSMVQLPNGCLASFSADRKIMIWNPSLPAHRRLQLTIDVPGPRNDSIRLGMLSNGFLVTCSEDNHTTLRVWNPANGRIVKETEHTMGHSAFRLDVLGNDNVVIHYKNGLVKIVNLIDDDLSRVLSKEDGDLSCLVQRPDGSLVSVHLKGPGLQSWNPHSVERTQIASFGQWFHCFARFTEDKLILITTDDFEIPHTKIMGRVCFAL